jgi:hypothetical protein
VTIRQPDDEYLGEIEVRCDDCEAAMVAYRVKAAALAYGQQVTAAKADAYAAAREDKAVANHFPWPPMAPQYGPDGPPE